MYVYVRVCHCGCECVCMVAESRTDGWLALSVSTTVYQRLKWSYKVCVVPGYLAGWMDAEKESPIVIVLAERKTAKHNPVNTFLTCNITGEPGMVWLLRLH